MSHKYSTAIGLGALSGRRCAPRSSAWAPPTLTRSLDTYSDTPASSPPATTQPPNDAYDILFGSAGTQGMQTTPLLTCRMLKRT